MKRVYLSGGMYLGVGLLIPLLLDVSEPLRWDIADLLNLPYWVPEALPWWVGAILEWFLVRLASKRFSGSPGNPALFKLAIILGLVGLAGFVTYVAWWMSFYPG